jgi:cysteine desulfurase family protein
MKRSLNQNIRQISNNPYADRRSDPPISTVKSLTTVYLDNAATSFPKPKGVSDEIVRAVNEYGGNPGRGSHILARRAASKINEARELAAQIFGLSRPENIVFTHNATEALNMTINAATKSGGHVLISDIEHNSVYRVLSELEKRGRVSLEIYPTLGDKEAVVKAIETRIRQDTVLVVACHRSNVAPIELPVEDIGALCRKKGIKFIVDASQSAGSGDVSVNRFSAWAVCAPGHKGLCGVQGSGLIAFGENVNAMEVTPFYFGGSALSVSESEMPGVFPHRMEAGTLPTPAIAGLCEGMKYIIERGTQDIDSHERSLIRYAKDALSSLPRMKIYLPGEEKGAVMLFNIDQIPCRDVGEYLDRQGICVRSGFHCAPLAHRRVGSYQSGGGVRVSVGPFSRKSDIDRLYSAIRYLVIR